MDIITVTAADMHMPGGGVPIKPAAEFEVLNGLGVEAKVAGRSVLVGSRAFLLQRGIDTQKWHARAEVLRAEAKTVVFLAVDGSPVALAAIADPVKESTPEAIAALKRAGVRIVMLTGDSQRTADAVARQLGIDLAIGEVRPLLCGFHFAAGNGRSLTDALIRSRGARYNVQSASG